MLQHRERLLHLSLTLVGQKVILQQTDGAIIEGIFHTFTPFHNLPTENKNKYVLKEIRIVQKPTSEENAVVLKEGATLIVPASKVVYVHAKNVDLDRPERTTTSNSNNSNTADINGSGGAGSTTSDDFATDTQISGKKGGKNRDLIAAGSAWTTAASSNSKGGIGGGGVAGGLEGNNYRNQPMNAPLPTNSRAAALGGTGRDKNNNKAQNGPSGGGGPPAVANLSGSIGEWDQFKANEELFNVNATYDENLYTTQLDKSAMDAKKIAEAERIAREIETSVTDNIHLAEERGHKIETDFDEEDLYSGVMTADGKQRHEAKVKISMDADKDVKADASSTAAPRKVMNYAAAAAKADGSKKPVPPGFAGSTSSKDGKEEKDGAASDTPPTPVTPDVKEKETKVPSKDNYVSAEKEDKKDESKAATDTKSNDPAKEKKEIGGKTETAAENEKAGDANDGEKTEVKKEAAKTSKLNANAKAFTFNPQAKSFTPTFATGGGGSSTAGGQGAQQPPQHPGGDPTMQMYGGGHPMQPPHYMQAGPMGQPGMFVYYY